jgi:predicted NAD/FAD-dependent oxidoreductase
VTLIDKGRRPGGRLSTRQSRSGPVFDHGAQYFTAKSATFNRAVDQWVSAGHAAEWDGRFVDLDGNAYQPTAREAVRYVGTPMMESVVAAEVEAVAAMDGISGGGPTFETEAAALERDGETWVVHDINQKKIGSFDRVILAIPIPQASKLIGQHSADIQDDLSEARVAPCWTLMLSFPKPLGVDFEGAFVEDDSPLSWIANNSSKPGRPDMAETGECWVIHAGGPWSQAHLEDAPEQVSASLATAFQQAIGKPLPDPRYTAVHRWRYAHVNEPIAQRWLHDASMNLAVCGDALTDGSQANIERAWLSGLALGEHLADA